MSFSLADFICRLWKEDIMILIFGKTMREISKPFIKKKEKFKRKIQITRSFEIFRLLNHFIRSLTL